MRNGMPLCVTVVLAVGGAGLVGCDRSEENKNVAPSNTRSAENTPDNVARREAQVREEQRNEAEAKSEAATSSGPTTRPSGAAQ